MEVGKGKRKMEESLMTKKSHDSKSFVSFVFSVSVPSQATDNLS